MKDSVALRALLFLSVPARASEDLRRAVRSEGVPICVWRMGGMDPARIADSKRSGIPVPSIHSPTFAPVPEPTLKACVSSMTTAVLELLATR